MKSIISILLITVLCSGCASISHSRKEKEWLGYMIAANIADAGTTVYALDQSGAEEMNPIFGSKDPDIMTIIGIKSLASLIAYTAGNIWPEDRLQIYKIVTYINMGISGWNVGQIITADK